MADRKVLLLDPSALRMRATAVSVAMLIALFGLHRPGRHAVDCTLRNRPAWPGAGGLRCLIAAMHGRRPDAPAPSATSPCRRHDPTGQTPSTAQRGQAQPVRASTPWPDLVEFVGALGLYDEFAAEYAPFDMQGMDNFTRPTHGLGTMIKLDQDPHCGWRSAPSAGFPVRVRRRAHQGRGRALVRLPARHAQDGGCMAPPVILWLQSQPRRILAGLRDGGGHHGRRCLVDDLENVLAVPSVDMVSGAVGLWLHCSAAAAVKEADALSSRRR